MENVQQNNSNATQSIDTLAYIIHKALADTEKEMTKDANKQLQLNDKSIKAPSSIEVSSKVSDRHRPRSLIQHQNNHCIHPKIRRKASIIVFSL